MPPLDAGEHAGQLFQAGEIVPGQEPVDERERSPHPAGERLVLRAAPSAD